MNIERQIELREEQRILFERWHKDTFDGYDEENDMPYLARFYSVYADSDVTERWLTWLAAAKANGVAL